MDLQTLQAKYGPLNPAQRAAAPKKGGFLSSILPAALSIVGGVGGTLLAPGVGTAAGGAAGAVLGKKLQDKMTGNHSSLSSYLGEAALGTLGGVGKGVQAGKAAVAAARGGEGIADTVKALRFGQQGSQALKGFNGLSNADKIVEANAANTGTGAPSMLGRVAGKADKVSQSALLSQSGGLTRSTAESAVRDVGKMKSLGYSNLDQMAEHAPHITGSNGVLTGTRDALLQKARPINAMDFQDLVKTHIGNNVDLTPAQAKNIENLTKGLADKFGFAGEGGVMGETPARAFDQGRRDLMTAAYKAPRDSATRNTLLDIGNSMRAPVEEALGKVPMGAQDKEVVINALKAKGIANNKLFTAIRNSSSAGDLSSIESPFVTASNMAKDSAEASLRAGAKTFDQSSKKITGMANEAVGSIVGAPAKRVVSKGADIVSNLVKPDVVSPATVPGVAGQTAKSMIKTQILPRLMTGNLTPTPAPADNSTASADIAPTGTEAGTDVGASAADGTDKTDQMKAALLAAMMSDVGSGGKNVASLSTIYKLLDANQATAKQTQSAQDVQGAINQIQTYSNILNTGAVGGAKGGILGRAETLLGKAKVGPYANVDAINSQRKEVGATIAKALTGNSRPAQNMIDAWAQALPGVDDPPASAKAKVDYILQLIQAKQDAMDSTSNNSTDLVDLLSSMGATQ